MAFNQKNVQKEGFKKSRFNYNHDVSSTYEFGECQPLLCHLCATGNESHNIRMNSIVRMSPLVFPTFGRVIHKVTHHFVPLSQLWQHWQNFLTDIDTTVERVDSSVITERSTLVSRIPSISLDCLMQILLRKEYSSYRWVGRSGADVINNVWDNLNVGQQIDAHLYNFFGYVNETEGLNFVSVADMDPYIDVTDPNAPMNLIKDSSDFSVMFHHDFLNVDMMLLVKLTTKGRRLFKILTGLGYTPSFTDHTDVNLLPLFAFYKAWFDAYGVQQYMNFYTSNCNKCMTHINSQGTIEIKGATPGFGQTSAFQNELLDFFDDLSECWYSENSDFVSSCLDAGGYLPSVSNTDATGLKYPALQDDSGYTVIDAVERVNGAGHGSANMNNGLAVTTQAVSGAMNRYLDTLSIEVMKKMYISVQRDSAIGFGIAQRLKARGFDTFVIDAKKYFLGTRSQPVRISDIDSTADTSNATLGAYAGKGVGVMFNDSINFTNSELGYIISISTIYPITKVVNALNPTHLGLTKFSFYNAQYDGLSYEQVPRSSVGHFTGTEYPAGYSNARLFGFHPRFTGYKTAPSNILNGGFALRSEFQNWLPYTLDRVVIENYHPSKNVGGTAVNPSFETDDIKVGQFYMPPAGLDWRFVANKPWKGNYNRIFANSPILQEELTYLSWNEKNPSSDNFFVNTEIDHKAFCSMLPIEDSWDAVDEEKPTRTMSINQ